MEFTGTTYEAAIAEAMKYYEVTTEALDISVLEEGSSSFFSKKPWRIEASLVHISAHDATEAAAHAASVQNTPDSVEFVFPSMEEANFTVRYTPEGVMLEAAKRADPQEIAEYVQRRGVRDADVQLALAAIRTGSHSALLAPPSAEPPPLDDYCVIHVARDDMSAVMKIYPGDEAGKRITPPDVLSYLRDNFRIVDGIQVDVMRDAVINRRFRQEFQIAAGRPPVDGKNGRLEFHFETEHSRRPKIMDGDKVDYRTLDIFASVKKGDLLVTRVPATKGVDGVNLRGKALNARSGKDAKLPRGKGVTIDDEALNMYAAYDGMVNFVDGQVIVSSLYVVENNVDMSTGNIDFAGDVEVRGNVIAGMTVRAEGNIEVQGIVEAATLIAGGNIVLRQGMQGNDRGTVTAGGDVVAKYFERTRVMTHGAITADAVYHCEMSAAEGITLVGRHASLIGGIARSATFVAARIVGSSSQTSTIVEVGILPDQRARYSEVEASIKRLESDKDKLTLLVTSFKAANIELPPDKAALRDKIMRGYETTLQQLDELARERAELAQQMAAVTSGKVHVTGTIHPGSRVVIGSESYYVELPVDFTTFRLIGGAIKFLPCEVSSKD